MELSILTIAIVVLVVYALGIVTGMYVLRNNVENKVLKDILNQGENLKDKVVDSLKKK